jgi:cytosine/adenosine deaminase-related metal-dependent hydrolase
VEGTRRLVTLILGDWLITSVQDPPRSDWGVRVTGGEITETGPTAELRERYPGDEVVEAAGRVIAPGFVDGHMHLYGTLAHGIPVANAPTDFWSFLDGFWWPNVEDALDHEMITAATEWVAAELLAGGVTTFHDVLEAPFALPDALFAQKEVVDRLGNRAILSFEATERVDATNGQLGLSENARFIEACRNEGNLVSGMMCYHTTFTCSPELIRQAFELACDLDVLCHAHVNEGTHEPQWCLDNKGMRTFEYYDELGVAGPRMLASQCVQLSARERRIIADRGVRCVHMPLSNGEVGGGIAPVPEQLAAGVTMGLGSDGYVTDAFEVMRGAFLIHKARLQDPQVMPACQVFGLATEGSARALGLDRVGRLEPGWAADLQLIDARFPTPPADHNLFDQIVLWRSRQDVTDVMVAGRWRVRDSEVLSVDRERLRARVVEQAERVWARI